VAESIATQRFSRREVFGRGPSQWCVENPSPNKQFRDGREGEEFTIFRAGERIDLSRGNRPL
jgi:hypothetical protein